MLDILNSNQDIDPIETHEWVEAIRNLIAADGTERAKFVLEKLMAEVAGYPGNGFPSVNTPYVNTIPPALEAIIPEDFGVARRLRAMIRWNAMMMVVRAGKKAAELGGHIASYTSIATLYEVGFNHFFHAPTEDHGGDLVYFQGHSSPGIYARSFLGGHLSAEDLDRFRQEVEAPGLSSYPHPWLMPQYWQFPTVSMGLGPIQAIFQARFLKYMHARGLADTANRHVWCYCGDGEMSEPESLGAITLAAREKLDNLVFVINCNLQRLDGPVHGNGKVIQEFEGVFRGAGWNVIKVIWGRRWDPLLAADNNGLLKHRMMEAIDGEYQMYKARDGAYVREHFFGAYEELKERVAHMTDDEVWLLNRGGLDAQKVFAAYTAATEHSGRPTVILAKTVKGFGMGEAGEGLNTTHQQKKMSIEQMKRYRDRFNLPISDESVENLEYYHPGDDSPEVRFLKERRDALGGSFPSRRDKSSNTLKVPELTQFDVLLKGSGEREISTTMAFVRLLNVLLKDKAIGKHIVPIVPDESRTFGMEGMFRQLGIYSPVGQLYEPVDHEQVMYYREEKDGQILQEGLNEAGAFCSWMSAATSYSSNDVPMVPFYIYYSMFGFQRIGDLAWAAGDMQARGFLLGGTSGRTTLAGEGLQHQDGHAHILANTIPNCVTYDPTYGYELAVIIQDGLRRMYGEQENVFYYISVMNENYVQPAMPEGIEQQIIKGMYCLQEGEDYAGLKVQLLGSGTILREVIKAAEILAEYKVSANIWSVTSFNELARDGSACERNNRLQPEKDATKPFVTQMLEERRGPVIAATDYMRAYSEQIRAFVPKTYVTLGTDGFGRSDTRAQLRHFFEVDAKMIAYTALKTLADMGDLSVEQVIKAREKLGINPEKPNPIEV